MFVLVSKGRHVEGEPYKGLSGSSRPNVKPESLYYYLPNPFFRLRLTPNESQLVIFWDLLHSIGDHDNSGVKLSAALRVATGTGKSVLTNSGRSALLLALKV